MNRRLNPNWCVWKICSKPLIQDKSQKNVDAIKPVNPLYLKLKIDNIPFRF